MQDPAPSVPPGSAKGYQLRMDREVNIESIRALEEQIGELERAAIKLKRTRNSLLNVSKLPPELLGEIFRWNVTPKGDFNGLDDRAHNFLLVCHHWFTVASCTPELWSFWGNTPEDWAQLCHRSGTTPIDLVLDGDSHDKRYFNGHTTLRDVLQDRATKNIIRRVHLAARDPEFLSSVTASLTSNHDAELQSNSIESLVLQNRGKVPADISDFFARQRFPKLRRLDLTNCTISPWDYLTSRTSALTTLALNFIHPSPTPTTSQLLSILASNPALQKISLLNLTIPGDSGDKSPIRVQPRHLKELQLGGDLQRVIRLLRQLDHPRNLDRLSLALHGCNVTDIPQTIGPYLRDHILRRNRSQHGLDVYLSSKDPEGSCGYHIEFHAGDAEDLDSPAPESAWVGPFFTITMALTGTPPKSVLERGALDLIAYAPLEEVVCLRAHGTPAAMEHAHPRFPNLRILWFDVISLPLAFPDPNLIGGGGTFPSLRHVLLVCVGVYNGDWSPLVTFLTSLVSFGARLDILDIAGAPHMCLDVEEDIRGMVRELRPPDRSWGLWCPFGTCPEP